MNNDKPNYVPDTNRLNDVAILRSFAIFSVVLYHCFWSPYLVFESSNIFIASVELSSVYQSFFYTFMGARMPLFIFISGYLFSYLLNKRGKYTSVTGFIKKKFTRLIIPYVIFSLAMGLMFMNLTVTNFLQGYMHLWFIVTLFWCFVIARLLTFANKSLLLQIAIFIISSIAINFEVTRFLCFDKLVKCFAWFWLGYIVMLNRDRLGFIFTLPFILISCFIWLGCALYFEYFPVYDYPSEAFVRNVFLYFSFVFFIFMVFSFVNVALNKKIIKMKPWVDELNKCSYGIYIFHQWLIIIITSKKIGRSFFPWIGTFGTEHSFIFPILLFIVVFTASILIARLFLKTSVGRFLIG